MSDLTPLAKITHVTAIDINHTSVKDLGPRVSLRELEFLHLAGTQVQDLGPLSKLSKLSTLNLMDMATPISAGQIRKLKAALPELSVIED